MKKRSDGLYQYQLYLGKDINGKRKYKVFYGKTQREAKAKAEEYRRGEATQKVNFSAVAARYLNLESQRITYPRYKTKRSRIEFFTQEFGNTDINYILPENIQTLINRIAAANPRTGKPTARQTLSQYLSAVNDVFTFAVKNRIINTNPCDFVSITAIKPKKERTALSKDERLRISACTYNRAWIAVFMMYTGLRRGEAAALTWADVDLKQKTITVNKSYDYKEYRIKPPKTKAGYRIIPIPDNLIPILEAHKGSKKENVILSAKGEMMTEQAWRRLNDKIVKETGVDFEWHQLRHTYTSVLYSAGVDVLTACQILGHSDVKTTMAIYTHLEDSKKKLSIDKLNDFLS